MKALGIVRKLDNLGRFVIPSETRNLHGWDINTPLEIFAVEDGVFVRTYKTDPSKEEALSYLRTQLEDATNKEDQEALKIAISYVAKG